MGKISIDSIVAQAVSRADVAEPDLAPFYSNLELLVNSINDEASLKDEVVGHIERYLSQPLRNRIEVSDWVKRFPEIRNEPIESPLFLTGLPRSGTTYFQYLFDPEPEMRMLRFWEGIRPCPPPGFAPDTISERINASARLLERRGGDKTASKMSQIHMSDADGPEECLRILDQTFLDVGQYWPFRVPTYFNRCLDTVDIRACYEYHKLVLQLLQWRGQKRRWVLKWPCHLIALEEILAVYPDAKFIVTHRDPVQALASNCSMSEITRRSSSTDVDNAEIGQQMEAMLQVYLERLVNFDAAHGDRIAHVPYQMAIEQPELAVANALNKLGMEMSPGFAEAIVAWRRDNPPGKRGAHSYSLENYGLNKAKVAEKYAFYTDRFLVPDGESASA